MSVALALVISISSAVNRPEVPMKSETLVVEAAGRIDFGISHSEGNEALTSAILAAEISSHFRDWGASVAIAKINHGERRLSIYSRRFGSEVGDVGDVEDVEDVEDVRNENLRSSGCQM
jgi:hypothetical protein